LLTLALVLGTLPDMAFGQVVRPVPGGPSAPSLGMAGNGTPIVNINKPNSAGVSNNTYASYNVGNGTNLILNNSTQITTTQTGGTISANSNLGGSNPASIILNQVVSANPTVLAGYTEVAGQNAQVVVANPWGISCNACGFLNTSHVTLTTGVPVFNSAGTIASYQVTQGTLSIDGQGLDATRVTTLDLFARAIQINAGLWANTVNVVFGAGSVDASTGAVTTISGASPAPAFGLDQSALGGMYAGYWTLAGTEAGVGVNLGGAVQASSGDVHLSAAGPVSVSGEVYASGAINFNAGDAINVSGVLYASGNAGVTASGALTDSGIIAAGRNLNMQGASASISGLVAAGLATNGTLAGDGSLALNATGSTTVSGQAAADVLALNSTGDTTISGAQANAGQIVGNVGGNLTIQSLQDTANQAASASSASGSISIGPGPGVGGGFSAANSNGNGSYASVTSPSGLFAGNGGYQVTVGGNTSLVGGSITSTQQAANDNLNSLTTGTLTVQNVQNSASYKASSVGISAGYSGGYIPGFGFPLALNNSGAQSSVTQSGITQNANGNTVTITNPAGQQATTGQTAAQAVASLATQSQGLTTDNAQSRANPLSQNPDVASLVSTDQSVQAGAANAVQSVVGAANAYQDRQDIVKAEQLQNQINQYNADVKVMQQASLVINDPNASAADKAAAQAAYSKASLDASNLASGGQLPISATANQTPDTALSGTPDTGRSQGIANTNYTTDYDYLGKCAQNVECVQVTATVYPTQLLPPAFRPDTNPFSIALPDLGQGHEGTSILGNVADAFYHETILKTKNDISDLLQHPKQIPGALLESTAPLGPVGQDAAGLAATAAAVDANAEAALAKAAAANAKAESATAAVGESANGAAASGAVASGTGNIAKVLGTAPVEVPESGYINVLKCTSACSLTVTGQDAALAQQIASQGDPTGALAFDQKVQVHNAQLVKTRQDALAKLSESLRPALIASITAHKCSAVFERANIYGFNAAMDITADVTARINATLQPFSFDLAPPPPAQN
jgi:filamentous hemagglutinin family protein